MENLLLAFHSINKMEDCDEIEFAVGQYKLMRRIGSGSFSTVWLGEYVVNCRNVAIKVISKNSVQQPNTLTRFMREISLLKHIDHPFISHFFEIVEDEQNFYLILEYAENGDLGSFLKEKGALTELQARHFFSELVSVLDYLHNEMHIAHRDIKPENILLDRFNNIRVIDFGLSNRFTDFDPHLNTACGSPAYAAPEMIRGEPYTKAADVWSAGILLYQMVCGYLPYGSTEVQDMLNEILTNDVKYPSTLPKDLIELLKSMLDKNCEKRATIQQIKEHNWIKSSGYKFYIDEIISNLRNQKNQIDKTCIIEMERMGFNTESLESELILEERTAQVSLYLQLMRDQMVFDLSKQIVEAKNKINKLDNAERCKSTPLAKSIKKEEFSFGSLVKIPFIPSTQTNKEEIMLSYSLPSPSLRPVRRLTPPLQ